MVAIIDFLLSLAFGDNNVCLRRIGQWSLFIIAYSFVESFAFWHGRYPGAFRVVEIMWLEFLNRGKLAIFSDG